MDDITCKNLVERALTRINVGSAYMPEHIQEVIGTTHPHAQGKNGLTEAACKNIYDQVQAGVQIADLSSRVQTLVLELRELCPKETTIVRLQQQECWVNVVTVVGAKRCVCVRAPALQASM